MDKPVFVIMGVCGSGKTTVGMILAERLGLPFYDADDFHPLENIEKMEQGIPLSDNDRIPWLVRLGYEIDEWRKETGAVLACSALKEIYRRLLDEACKDIQWIYLEGSEELLTTRMRNRRDHFMPPELLESQLTTLEKPQNALVVDITPPPEKIVETILDIVSRVGVPADWDVGAEANATGVESASLPTGTLARRPTLLE